MPRQVRVVTFSFLCPLLEKYGTFIARCNALIEKVSPCIGMTLQIEVPPEIDAEKATERGVMCSVLERMLRADSEIEKSAMSFFLQSFFAGNTPAHSFLHQDTRREQLDASAAEAEAARGKLLLRGFGQQILHALVQWPREDASSNVWHVSCVLTSVRMGAGLVCVPDASGEDVVLTQCTKVLSTVLHSHHPSLLQLRNSEQNPTRTLCGILLCVALWIRESQQHVLDYLLKGNGDLLDVFVQMAADRINEHVAGLAAFVLALCLCETDSAKDSNPVKKKTIITCIERIGVQNFCDCLNVLQSSGLFQSVAPDTQPPWKFGHTAEQTVPSYSVEFVALCRDVVCRANTIIQCIDSAEHRSTFESPTPRVRDGASVCSEAEAEGPDLVCPEEGSQPEQNISTLPPQDENPLQGESTTLQEAAKERSTTGAADQEAHAQLESRLASADRAARTAAEQIGSLTAEKERLLADQIQLKHQADQMRGDVDRISGELVSANGEIERLRQQVVDQETEKTQFEAELRSAEDLNKQMAAEVERNAALAESSSEQLMAEHRKVSANFLAAQQQLHKLEQQQRQQQQDAEQHAIIVTQLQAQCAEQDKLIVGLKAERDAQARGCSEVEAELRVQLSQLQQDLAELRDVRDELRKAEEQNELLQAENAATNGQAAERQRALETLTEELQGLRTAATEWASGRQQVVAATAEVEALKAELEQMQQQKAQAEATSTERQNVVDLLQNELSKLQEASRSWSDSQKQVQAAANVLTGQDAAESERSQLRHALDAANARCVAANEDSAALRLTIDELQAAAEGQQRKVDDLGRQLREAHDREQAQKGALLTLQGVYLHSI
eukprot:SAG31_NODE_2627_length_5351_cov_3.055979_4_plen_844_part_00